MKSDTKKHWERKKAGFYVYNVRELFADGFIDCGILAEVVKGADDHWWVQYLDSVVGWTIERCKSLKYAKSIVAERVK